MKKTIIIALLGVALLPITTLTAAVISTSTVITGNGAVKVTQAEVLNSSVGAGTLNEDISVGGINVNSKWNFLMQSDEDITQITSIIFTLTGPTGLITPFTISNSVYNVLTDLGSPTVGVYNDAGTINITPSNGNIISGYVLPSGVRQLVIADRTISAGFLGGLYNADNLGETLSGKFTVTGQSTSGAFTSESTSMITVIPEPSSGILAMVSAVGVIGLRRRR